MDEPVAALVAVGAPGLDRERDVCVEAVFGGAGFVGVADDGLDGFGLVEAPFGEGLEEAELGRVSEEVGD